MAKILVVDDEGFVRELIRTYLRGCGHTVAEAADGQEALEKFWSDPADLIISDNAMPRMSGSEMVRILRSEGAPVKILGITGLNVDCDSADALDGILHKPFTRDTFLDAVGGLLAPTP